MSSAKFASITAGLLARKGEAQPWEGMKLRDMRALPWRPRAPESAAAPPPPAKDKSCSIRLSRQDFERLGILSVKSGTSRRHLLQEAVSQFLAAKARVYSCVCMGACDKACESN